jgi:nucleotide-binding universal stress UspA family protein
MSTPVSRLLVAVSSNLAAERLAGPACDLAKRLAAEVLVVHVSRPAGGQMRQQEQAEGETAIALMRTKLQERGVVTQTLLMFSDDIARALITTAEERQCTAIVLGLTGKNIFARLLAGNVPVELIKSTQIPVLLLPPDWDGVI